MNILQNFENIDNGNRDEKVMECEQNHNKLLDIVISTAIWALNLPYSRPFPNILKLS